MAELAQRAAAQGVAQVGVRPVTDTLKALDGDRVVGTIDRASVVYAVGPLVEPDGRILRGTPQEIALAVEQRRAEGVDVVVVDLTNLLDTVD